MFAFPAARVRAGINYSVRLSLPVLTMLCLQGVARAADNEAETVLKKMQTMYETAKTYKGTVKSVQAGKTQDGKAYSLTTTQEIRYKMPNLFWIRLSYSNATGAAAKANGTSQLISCDGKSVYQYLSTRKQYMKRPALPKAPPVGPASIKLDLSTAKMLPASTIGGHAVYIIQVDQQMPPNVPPDQAAKIKPQLKANLAVEKNTYYLLRISKPNGENATDFTDQAVNSGLSDNSFTFVPPPGATLFTPPPAGAPGAPGAPGGPGAPPRQ